MFKLQVLVVQRKTTEIRVHVGLCQDAELCRQSEGCLTYSQRNLRYGPHYANPSRFTLNVSVRSEFGRGAVVRMPAGMKFSPYKTSKHAL